MKILGIDSTENETLFLTRIDLKTLKVKLFNPKKYIGEKFKFYVEFLNGKKIEMNFLIKNLNELNYSQTKKKPFFELFMEICLITFSLLILVALGILIKLMRDKGSEYMQTRTMMTENNNRVDGLSDHVGRKDKFNLGEI
jgi:hypothetical protein